MADKVEQFDFWVPEFRKIQNLLRPTSELALRLYLMKSRFVREQAVKEGET